MTWQELKKWLGRPYAGALIGLLALAVSAVALAVAGMAIYLQLPAQTETVGPQAKLSIDHAIPSQNGFRPANAFVSNRLGVDIELSEIEIVSPTSAILATDTNGAPGSAAERKLSVKTRIPSLNPINPGASNLGFNFWVKSPTVSQRVTVRLKYSIIETAYPYKKWNREAEAVYAIP